MDRIRSRGREAVGCSAGELAGDSEADWAPSLLSPTAEQPSLALPQLHPHPSTVSVPLRCPGITWTRTGVFCWLPLLPGDPAMPPPTRRRRGHWVCMYSRHSPDPPPLNGLLQSHPAPRQAAATLPPKPMLTLGLCTPPPFS